jgi:hypothetical protein
VTCRHPERFSETRLQPMTLLVAHTHEGWSAPSGANAVSPELALVDPALAEHARSWLPQPDDTLARFELLVRAHRIAASREQEVVAPPVADERPAMAGSEPKPRRQATRRRRTPVLAASAAAAAFAAALLVGVRVDLQGSPAGADSTSIGEPPVAVAQPENTTTSVPPTPVLPRTKRSRPRATKPSRPRATKPPTSRAPRRFVWAAVAGVSGYRVEFFRGAKLVFSADTAQPEISIPESWTFAGKRRTLGSGEYRWYVWTVSSGLRNAQAIVQAKLVVPAR